MQFVKRVSDDQWLVFDEYIGEFRDYHSEIYVKISVEELSSDDYEVLNVRAGMIYIMQIVFVLLRYQ